MSVIERLEEILREKSVRIGTFTLASGKTSDFYVDVKQTSLNAEGAYLIASAILERLHPEAGAIGGMTLGADPIACAVVPLAWHQDRPLHGFIIRKEPKGHGTRSYLEGGANLPEGTKVTMVEDTTTTGGSLLKAIEPAEQAGLEVIQCITVVDRQEGASERLAELGYKLESLTTREALMRGA